MVRALNKPKHTDCAVGVCGWDLQPVDVAGQFEIFEEIAKPRQLAQLSWCSGLHWTATACADVVIVVMRRDESSDVAADLSGSLHNTLWIVRRINCNALVRLWISNKVDQVLHLVAKVEDSPLRRVCSTCWGSDVPAGEHLVEEQ